MAFLWLEFYQSFQVLAIVASTLAHAVAFGFRFWVGVSLPAAPWSTASLSCSWLLPQHLPVGRLRRRRALPGAASGQRCKAMARVQVSCGLDRRAKVPRWHQASPPPRFTAGQPPPRFTTAAQVRRCRLGVPPLSRCAVAAKVRAPLRPRYATAAAHVRSRRPRPRAAAAHVRAPPPRSSRKKACSGSSGHCSAHALIRLQRIYNF
jgi:hypothetical protein